MTKHYIDCRTASFGDEPLRVFADFDTQEDKLSISGILPYQPPANPFKGKSLSEISFMKEILKNTVIVTDLSGAFKKWDLCFNIDENLDEAIKSYYALDAMHRIDMSTEISSTYNLRSVIELRKMDVSGNTYELDFDQIQNGHIAILMICWAYKKMHGNSRLVTEDISPTQQDIDAFNVPFCL